MGTYTVRVTTAYYEVEGSDAEDAADNYYSSDGNIVKIEVYDGKETTVILEDENDVDLSDEED